MGRWGWHVEFEREFELEVKSGKHEFNEKCKFEAKWRTRARARVNKRVNNKKREKDSRERPRHLEKCRQTGRACRVRIQRIHGRKTENQRA